MTPVPLHPSKLDQPSILTPAAFAEHNSEAGWLDGHTAPESALLLYHRDLAEAVVERLGGAAHVRGFIADYFLLDAFDRRVALVANFGIGAPAAAFVLEDLVHAGVGTACGVGTCGSLQPHLQAGAIVLADGALRDEGTSYHYLPDGAPVGPDAGLADAVARELDAAGCAHTRGAVWTTDAPYRETAVEVRAHREAGVLAVEMEAAALFAVAQSRGVRAATVLVVSDVLEDHDWTPQFHAEPTMAGLHAAVDAALAAVTAE